MKRLSQFILGCILGMCLVLLVSTCSGADLTAEDRAVIVETFRRIEQTNRLYQYMIPESARYFEGKADAYAAAADFVANYQGTAPVASTLTETANVEAPKPHALTQALNPRPLRTRKDRFVNGRRCL